MQAREPAKPVVDRREAAPEGRADAPAAAAPAPAPDDDAARSEGAGTVIVEVPAAWEMVVGALAEAASEDDAAEEAAAVEDEALRSAGSHGNSRLGYDHDA